MGVRPQDFDVTPRRALAPNVKNAQRMTRIAFVVFVFAGACTGEIAGDGSGSGSGSGSNPGRVDLSDLGMENRAIRGKSCPEPEIPHVRSGAGTPPRTGHRTA